MKRRLLQILLGFFFMAAGSLHFINPEFYLRIMPPYLPAPMALVALSGAAEIALGALVLWEKTRRLSAWGLILLLIAVFPANLHLAFHPEIFPNIPPVFLWVRLPIQLVFILWAYLFTRKHKEGEFQ